MLLLKGFLICIFALIFFQDCKDRKVYWFLYPLVGILVFNLQIQSITIYPAMINVLINLLFVSLMILVCYLYAKLKLKKSFLNAVLGLGDILFFVFISFSFSFVSFLVLFVFSLLFSLVLHLVLKHRNSEKTVPLAGYMSLFFGVIYGIGFFCESNFLYAY